MTHTKKLVVKSKIRAGEGNPKNHSAKRLVAR